MDYIDLCLGGGLFRCFPLEEAYYKKQALVENGIQSGDFFFFKF